LEGVVKIPIAPIRTIEVDDLPFEGDVTAILTFPLRYMSTDASFVLAAAKELVGSDVVAPLSDLAGVEPQIDSRTRYEHSCDTRASLGQAGTLYVALQLRFEQPLPESEVLTISHNFLTEFKRLAHRGLFVRGCGGIQTRHVGRIINGVLGRPVQLS
jgi:hypothetical protein